MNSEPLGLLRWECWKTFPRLAVKADPHSWCLSSSSPPNTSANSAATHSIKPVNSEATWARSTQINGSGIPKDRKCRRCEKPIVSSTSWSNASAHSLWRATVPSNYENTRIGCSHKCGTPYSVPAFVAKTWRVFQLTLNKQFNNFCEASSVPPKISLITYCHYKC